MSLEDPDDLPAELNLAELKEELAQKGKVKCPIDSCKQDFKSLWGLKYHVKRTNHEEVGGKFKCDQCSLLFQSRVGLRQHRVAQHSGSESGSPLSSPSSRDKEMFHFPSSTLNSGKSKVVSKQSQAKAEKNSHCVLESKKSKGKKTNHDLSGNSSMSSTHLNSNAGEEDLSCTDSVIGNNATRTTCSNSDDTAIATPLRKSTRKRTQRKFEVEVTYEKKKSPGVSKDKKLKRKVDFEESSDVESQEKNKDNASAKTPARKRGRPRKVDVASVVNSVREPDDCSRGDDTTAKKQKRTPPKKKKAEVPEKTRLKKILNSGQKLSCPNADCVSKFTSVLGYKHHVSVCGQKMEERPKFPCEECGKVYFSTPGLQYHIKAVHTKIEPSDSDHSEEKTETEEDAEVLEGGRTRRRAATRAIKKFSQIATADSENAASKPKRLKQDSLDQLIVRMKESKISQEQEDEWSKTLKDELTVQCSNKGCSETFDSVSSIKEHMLTCSHRSGSFRCLACNRVCLSFHGARKHVKELHVGLKPQGKDNSDSSDEDFNARSSEESEEDSDDVEIEVIEEVDSDLDERDDDFMATEEIVIWDKDRKRFRRPTGRAKGYSPRAGRNTADRPLGFGPIGQKSSYSYMTTEKWHREEYKHTVLFPKLRPSTKYWSKVEASEMYQYLPSATMSPHFQIRRRGTDPDTDTTEDLQLPLFESTSKEDSGYHGDVTFNVGGPVWAMNWCPVPDSNGNEEQILAISTHRSLDEVHNMHKCVSGRGLIQLWSVGQLDVGSASSGSKPKLSLGIAHDFGALWDMSWCPSGTWESGADNKLQADCLPRLGLLALACGDGHVRILSIPWPKRLLSALDMDQSDASVMVQAKPHVVLTPCALGVDYSGQCGQAWCAKWFPGSMHEKIATGFSDGTVAIWNLLTESPLLKKPLEGEPLAFSLAPFLHIKANSSIVKDVAWCPHEPHVLVTGSYDRCYKLWNLKSPLMPFCNLKRGVPHEIHWPVVFETFVSCEDDSFQNLISPAVARHLCFIPREGSILTNLTTVHNSTIWSISVSDWCNVLANGDAAGEVEGVLLSLMENRKRRSLNKFGIYRACLEKLDDEKAAQKDKEREEEPKGPSHSGDNQPQTNEESLEQDNPCTVKEEDKVHPGTVEKVFQKYRLVFHDVNALQFKDSIIKSDPEFRRLLTPSAMQSTPCDEVHPEAVHKVRFNPNKQSFSWLASGGAAGLARLHLVKEVK